jgi:uncharacterized protein YlbG (UPF0298 family)
MIERKGLIVYFEDKEVLNKLDKNIVNIYYVSERNNYAIIYCDLNRYKPLCSQLQSMKGIISFEDSMSNVEANSFELNCWFFYFFVNCQEKILDTYI